MSIVRLPPDAPTPRLCLICKLNENQEYGFNLHAERGKNQFVGAVDDNSPANQAGLQSGDRIYAVNGESIAHLSHKDVVRRIKFNPLQCELLVIDEQGSQWYENHKIRIDLNLSNIEIYRKDENDQNNLDEYSAINSQHLYSYTSVSAPPSPMVAKAASTNLVAPRPRLCHLLKESPTDEFGFNLHAERSKGHFIGSVDKNGIADRAGLETGQRIVGVNGHLIYPNTAHKEVVSLIKRDPLKTELLVASENVDRWYLDSGVLYSYDCVQVYEPMGTANYSPSSYQSNSHHQFYSSTNLSTPEYKTTTVLNLHQTNGDLSRSKTDSNGVQNNNGYDHCRQFPREQVSNEKSLNNVLSSENVNLPLANNAEIIKVEDDVDFKSIKSNTGSNEKDVTITVCDNNTTSIRLKSIQDSTLAEKIASNAVAALSKDSCTMIFSKNDSAQIKTKLPNNLLELVLNTAKPPPVSPEIKAEIVCEAEEGYLALEKNSNNVIVVTGSIDSAIQNELIDEKTAGNCTVLKKFESIQEDSLELSKDLNYHSMQSKMLNDVKKAINKNSNILSTQSNGNTKENKQQLVKTTLNNNIDNGVDDSLKEKNAVTNGNVSPSSSNVSGNYTTVRSLPLIVPPPYSSTNVSQDKKSFQDISQQLSYNKQPLFENLSEKDENRDIFKLSAKEALLAMRQRSGGKKTNDPRLGNNNNLSLEEKYNRIANL